MPILLKTLICAALFTLCGAAQAAQVRVAVASNFAVTLNAIAHAFEKESAHRIEITAGSTGSIYAQITQGAPFDMFFAADIRRPAQLETDDLIVPGSRKTYARGQLALWVPGSNMKPGAAVDQIQALLRQSSPLRIAIANPALAPYGAAAQTVLKGWGLDDLPLVYGQDVGQTFSYIKSGNARAGFVAAAQLFGRTEPDFWSVPADLHKPIDQQMVILKRAATNPAATALYSFMASAQVAAILAARGYTAVVARQ